MPHAFDPGDDHLVDRDPLLLAVLQAIAGPGTPHAPPRPDIPLAQSALLVNGRGQPRVGAEIARELESADAVDLLCAFIKWQGVRTMQRQLEELNAPLRVITTTYIGATERKALDFLAGIGAQIKISYETRTTRLHAKAWLFHRRSGFSTGYVGSSNLSRSALLDGLEWNMRIAEAEQPHILETFRATFDDYWADPSFEPYDPQRDGARFEQAVAKERGGPIDDTLEMPTLDVQPYPYQKEMLESLEAERTLHDRWRNLVVAATGTGKTVLAALDYRTLKNAGVAGRLLFVAHREEILRQSLTTFRHVMHDGAFGEFFVAGQRPSEWKHVFASIQSLAKMNLDQIPPGQFDMVIVDEFHHAEAPTYQKLLEHVTPKVLLGLTATPERADGRDIKQWFDGRIAVELRLWEALDRGLLSPFQYFGLHDDVDLSRVTWRRGQGYDTAELTNVYTANDARARKVAEAVVQRIGDVGGMRALGFCVSIAHAEFMARKFNEFGIPSEAISALTHREERASALARLRSRETNVIFAVDLFNEGLDVPEIDTVLFLRPTESATVFLQQLGRGLRHADEKACLTVLDFIGNQNKKFRFDLRYRALTGVSRRELARDVEEGFPYLPSGCHMELDRVASEIVLRNIRQSLNVPWTDLVAELRRLGDVPLVSFLEETDLAPEDLYRRRKGGWTGLRREAGLESRAVGPLDERLGAALGRMTHVDDLARIHAYKALVSGGRSSDRFSLMLHYVLWGSDEKPETLSAMLEALRGEPARVEEIVALLDVQAERLSRVTRPAAGTPLHIHARYTRDEALAAFGHQRPGTVRQGVYPFPGADVFFVTLNKTEKHYSPTTLYRDYAMSPDRFHWESQSTTGENSPTGQRYINHERMGSTVHLLLRENRIADGALGAPPYLYAGPARYVSHQQERPMQIIWRLENELPADVFQAAKVVAG